MYCTIIWGVGFKKEENSVGLGLAHSSLQFVSYFVLYILVGKKRKPCNVNCSYITSTEYKSNRTCMCLRGVLEDHAMAPSLNYYLWCAEAARLPAPQSGKTTQPSSSSMRSFSKNPTILFAASIPTMGSSSWADIFATSLTFSVSSVKFLIFLLVTPGTCMSISSGC